MNKKVFVGFFLVIIFSIFLFVPIKEVLIHLNVLNFYKTDNWKIIPKSNDPIYDKIESLKANLENRYNNYFPFYVDINSYFYKSVIKIDSLFNNDIYLKDNNDLDHIFYDKKNNFFYLVNNYSKEEIENRLNEQAAFYNDIKRKYPSVSLSLYVPLRLESTSFKNINHNNDYINRFLSLLDNNINYKTFDSNSLDQYLKYFYKSDHHYNSYGAERAFLDILDMFGFENNTKITHKTVKDEYCGSMAKSTLLKLSCDKLTVMDVPNNFKVIGGDKDFKPLTFEVKENPFYDYYVKYFNGAYDEIIYESNNNYNRNLLIIGDSMAWQIDYLLANYFDKTYIVNTKYGKWINNDLYLDSYINDKNITHILFLREAKNIVFDADNFHVDKKVIR